tara:strand:+ start:1129 stop:1689 length:561 start_codon:yes stop_codon:yes gene_type:complete
LKRFLDLLFSLFLLLILIFPLLIICFLIKLDSRGPALNISKRIGKNKKVFKMFKFRTMKLDTPIINSNNLKDPNLYITKFGKKLRKYSIDELPQIINILLGDMSFVGPRPSLDNQLDLIEKRDLHNIHILKPGLTGLAQINGRDNLSLDKKVEFDNFYLLNQSLLLDVKILFKTIILVFNSKNITH